MNSRRALLAGAVASILAGAAAPALAQDGVALNQFDPAPAGDRFFGVQSPDVRGHLRLRGMVLLDYAHNPLVLRNTTNDSQYGKVVSNQLWVHLAPSLALWNRVLVSLDAPIALVQSGDSPSGGGLSASSPDSAQMGDLRVGGRVRLFGPPREGMQLALGAHLWLPTGARDAYVSDGAVRGSPFALVGGNEGRLAWSAQLGMMLRQGQKLAGTPVGNAITFGAGLGYFLDGPRTLMIGPELYGQTIVAQGGTVFGKRSTNAELLAGAKWRPGGGDWVLGAGIGPGLGRGAGTPDFRALASLAWSPEDPPPLGDRDRDGVPDPQDACPDQAGVRTSDPQTNGCPLAVSDRDGDGVVDSEDACPDVKGEKTGDPKTHGCPPDRDKDGVPDAQDACPDVAGVATTDPKTHGCPADTDGDGIPDSEDACPTVQGVKSPLPAANGCPPDADGDKIPDAEDACPKLAGPANADPKLNGCPPVQVTEEQIVILQQIQFETAKAVIRPESYPILNDVVNIMKKHPEIAKIEVGGHTDNQGPAYLNRKLSNDRARSVVKYLVDGGIDAGRLSARGYGPDKPIADNKTEEGRAKNRRVEFKIIKEGGAKPGGKTPAPKPKGGAQ